MIAPWAAAAPVFPLEWRRRGMAHCGGGGSLKMMLSQRNLAWIHHNTALLKGMARLLLPPLPPRKKVGQLRLLCGRELEAVAMRGAKARVCSVCPPLARLHPHPMLDSQVCA